MQCIDYLHEFPIEYFVDFPKLNPKANVNLLVHIFDLFIPLSLKDFDANVSPFTFDFFMILAMGLLLLLTLLINVVFMNLLPLDLMLLKGINVNLLLKNHC